MKAKDLMTRDVVTLSPLTDLETAACVFAEKRITGAPVVDARGRLLGAVSQSDLIRFRAHPGLPSWEDEDKEFRRAPVISVMTTQAVSCDEDTEAEELAYVMRERHIHRVFITRDGRLSGIVSTMDLLKAMPCGRPETEGRRPS